MKRKINKQRKDNHPKWVDVDGTVYTSASALSKVIVSRYQGKAGTDIFLRLLYKGMTAQEIENMYPTKDHTGQRFLKETGMCAFWAKKTGLSRQGMIYRYRTYKNRVPLEVILTKSPEEFAKWTKPMKKAYKSTS